MGSNPVGVTTSWGYSSAGRARALQARGHRFEPCCPHHIKKRATLYVVLFLCVGKQHRAQIRRVIRLCTNPCAPCAPVTLHAPLTNASISASLLTSLLSHVINCAFDQTNSFYLFVCLMLVYSFSPRVHSIPRGPHILKKRIKMMCCFCCMGQFTGENPKTCFRRSAVACKRLRYAPCVTLQTLCVALLFILDLHYAEHALLSPRHKLRF